MPLHKIDELSTERTVHLCSLNLFWADIVVIVNKGALNKVFCTGS